jgi:transposase
VPTGLHSQKKTVGAKERESERIVALRGEFLRAQVALDPKRLVFLDESGFRLGASPRYGWSERGDDCPGTEVCGCWTTMTMMGAIGLDGFRGFATFDCTTSGESFLAFIEHQVCPALRPGDLVVMDNLAAHKVQGVQATIEKAGASVCFLPPYSPEFNPIEKLWAKLKEIVRRAATDTREMFDAAVATAMDAITSSDLEGWYRHCGYRLDAN